MKMEARRSNICYAVYDGASNGKNFGPSSHSMIYANDYGTPEKLAEYLLYLDKNDTAYLSSLHLSLFSLFVDQIFNLLQFL